MNFFDHKDLGNHLLQLRPKVVKHPVEIYFCEDNSDYNDNDNAVDEVIIRQGMYVPGPLKSCVLRFEFPTRCGCNPCTYLLHDNVNRDVQRKDL